MYFVLLKMSNNWKCQWGNEGLTLRKVIAYSGVLFSRSNWSKMLAK